MIKNTLPISNSFHPTVLKVTFYKNLDKLVSVPALIVVTLLKIEYLRTDFLGFS